jgi:hypothetical protein
MISYLKDLQIELFNEILLFISNDNIFNKPQIRFSERTSTLLRLSYCCKELYERLLCDKIILLNCKFSLKMNATISEYFNDNDNQIRKPNYLISNLDLSWNKKISDKDFKLICIDLRGINFELKKLYINYCSKESITNQAFEYLFNENNENNNNDLIELEMTNCSKLITSEIINKYLFSSSKFSRIESLNLFFCANLLNDDNGESEVNNFDSKYLKKLNIGFSATNDQVIENLINLEELSIPYCNKITSGAFKKLEKLKKLNISTCDQLNVEQLFMNLNKAVAAAFSLNNLNFETNLIELDISKFGKLNDSCFKYFKKLKVLKM